jgi:Raf kinase inhibitor-like YbhB/YbcL family protein
MKQVHFLGMLLALAGAGCRGGTPQDGFGDVPMTLKLTSSAFQEGETIPKKHTGDGPDVSPPLAWDDPPDGTKSLALICDDPDAPSRTWVHWVIFNIPSDARKLDEAVPARRELEGGAKQGKNDFGNLGYGGPAPPKGKPHRYFFKLYALDTTLDLPGGSTKDQLTAAMQGHVLAQGQLIGTYQRP